ncbi:hypothetical protein CC78DRAFT_564342 [Lojkania enalia]|uniref:Uncharacterized protein n=1 Tax=Lojkania enalia TaxID=147567 RepID=A0A9P4NBW9_9PLEO|nr:hypothetical protein CC78DRAFT_564342 [Didymosphaeria enalia]
MDRKTASHYFRHSRYHEPGREPPMTTNPNIHHSKGAVTRSEAISTAPRGSTLLSPTLTKCWPPRSTESTTAFKRVTLEGSLLIWLTSPPPPSSNQLVAYSDESGEESSNQEDSPKRNSQLSDGKRKMQGFTNSSISPFTTGNPFKSPFETNRLPLPPNLSAPGPSLNNSLQCRDKQQSVGAIKGHSESSQELSETTMSGGAPQKEKRRRSSSPAKSPRKTKKATRSFAHDSASEEESNSTRSSSPSLPAISVLVPEPSTPAVPVAPNNLAALATITGRSHFDTLTSTRLNISRFRKLKEEKQRADEVHSKQRNSFNPFLDLPKPMKEVKSSDETQNQKSPRISLGPEAVCQEVVSNLAETAKLGQAKWKPVIARDGARLPQQQRDKTIRPERAAASPVATKDSTDRTNIPTLGSCAESSKAGHTSRGKQQQNSRPERLKVPAGTALQAPSMPRRSLGKQLVTSQLEGAQKPELPAQPKWGCSKKASANTSLTTTVRERDASTEAEPKTSASTRGRGTRSESIAIHTGRGKAPEIPPPAKLTQPVPTKGVLELALDSIENGAPKDGLIGSQNKGRGASSRADAIAILEIKKLTPAAQSSSETVDGITSSFEYTVYQKSWSENEPESSTATSQVMQQTFRNIGDANRAAKSLYLYTNEHHPRAYSIQFKEWHAGQDEAGCASYFAVFQSPHLSLTDHYLKIWVSRRPVLHHESILAPPSTLFVTKSVFILRLYKLLYPEHPADKLDSDVDADADGDEEVPDAEQTPICEYHPILGGEIYTVLDSANRAARNLQIELSHKKHPQSIMEKKWQEEDLRKLNDAVHKLDLTMGGEAGFWNSRFNGLGGEKFELKVEKVGLTGPRNL